MAKFAVCVPDYARGLIWCQHFNGSWAPPFPMTAKENTPVVADVSSENV